MDKYKMDSTKLLYHMDRVYEHYRDGKRIAPIHIDIGATSACNSNCIYCYARHQKKSGEILNRDVFINLLSQAPEVGIKSIAIIGDGEPTLNPALYDAVRAGRENGLDISVGTNGIFLDTAKLTNLLSNCVWIRFNLSAGTRDGYKFVHGFDNWEVVSENIREAVRIKKEKGFKCTIGLQMVLVPQCLNEVIPEAEFAIDAGVDYLVVKQYSDPICNDMVQVDRGWYISNDTTLILQRAEKLSTSDTEIIIKWGLMQFHDNKPYKSCVDVPLLIEGSGTGKLYPCGYHFRNDEYCLGDLNKNSIKEIIESDHYWNLIERLRNDFVVGKDCHGACRHDMTNCFIWDYLQPLEHENFI